MPTPTKGPRLGGSSAHQRHILANLATALFEHGKITTTEAKARRLRPFAERLITYAKRGDLHARRQVLTDVTDKSVVHTLFSEIGPGFAARDGGYTRITKVGPRKGDNAAMAVIELVREEAAPAPSRRRRGRRPQARRPRAGVAATETADEGQTAPDSESGAPAAGAEETAEAPVEKAAEGPAAEAGAEAGAEAEGAAAPEEDVGAEGGRASGEQADG